MPFSVFYTGLRRKIKPIRENIDEAIESISKLPESHELISEFSQFNETIRKNPIFAHHWNEYFKSLIIPSAASPDQIIQSTDEAACYFNENTILVSRVNLRFYNAFPNYLTGGGILGTFIGLVSGIYLASHGLGSDNPAQLNQSLQQLLSGASLAFCTSIVGIISSIIFSWREKAIIHKVSFLISKFNREIDKRILRVTSESLSQKQLRQLTSQTEYLEEFTTQVAFNIAEALDTKMNEKLVPTLEKLIESVEQLRQEKGDSNVGLIEKIVEDFKKSMNQAAGSEIESLANTLNSLNDTLVPLLSEMNSAQKSMQSTALYIASQIKDVYEKSGAEFSEGIKIATTSLSNGITEAGSLLNKNLKDSFDKAVDRLESTIEKMDMSIENAMNATDSSRQLNEKTIILLDRFDESANAINNIQKKAIDTLVLFEQTAKSIENAGNTSQMSISEATKAIQEIKIGINEFKTFQMKLEQVWQDYADRFENLDTVLEKVFEQLQQGLKGFAEATSEFMSDLDQQAAKVTQLFGGAVEEFGESIEEMSEILGKVIKT